MKIVFILKLNFFFKQNGLNRVVGLASYNVGSANDANNDVIYCTSEAHFTKLSSAKAFIQKTIGYGHC